MLVVALSGDETKLATARGATCDGGPAGWGGRVATPACGRASVGSPSGQVGDRRFEIRLSPSGDLKSCNSGVRTPSQGHSCSAAPPHRNRPGQEVLEISLTRVAALRDTRGVGHTAAAAPHLPAHANAAAGTNARIAAGSVLEFLHVQHPDGDRFGYHRRAAASKVLRHAGRQNTWRLPPLRRGVNPFPHQRQTRPFSGRFVNLVAAKSRQANR